MKIKDMKYKKAIFYTQYIKYKIQIKVFLDTLRLLEKLFLIIVTILSQIYITVY